MLRKPSELKAAAPQSPPFTDVRLMMMLCGPKCEPMSHESLGKAAKARPPPEPYLHARVAALHRVEPAPCLVERGAVRVCVVGAHAASPVTCRVDVAVVADGCAGHRPRRRHCASYETVLVIKWPRTDGKGVA